MTSSRRGRERKMKYSKTVRHRMIQDRIQDTNIHQTHPHCFMWKPRIPLHQYLDTEYVSILNMFVVTLVSCTRIRVHGILYVVYLYCKYKYEKLYTGHYNSALPGTTRPAPLSRCFFSLWQDSLPTDHIHRHNQSFTQ